MTASKNAFAAKFGVIVVAVAMLFTFAAPAQAQQTTEELQDMINQLLQQIDALQAQVGQTGTAAPAGVCPYTWTRNLGQGDRGEDVMRLQQLLNSDPETRVAASGVGSAGMETEYYGPMTAAAVSTMQMKYRADILTPVGLVNPTGFFGPSSRAKANALCAEPVMPEPEDEDEVEEEEETVTGPAPLQGGEATIDNFRVRAGEFFIVRAGQSDVPVAEVHFDVEDGDVSVNRLDLALAGTSSGGPETRPWETFRSIALWVDGDKVAEMDVDRRSDWSRNIATIGGEDYDRIRFTGLDLVFREGDRAEILVAVTPRSTIRGVIDTDTSDWSLRVPASGMRVRDAVGIDTFEPQAVQPVGTGAGIEFEIEEAGADDELRVRSSSADPRATTIELDDTRRSNFLTVFAFDLDTRDSENEIEILSMDIDLDFTAQTGTTSYDNIVNDARLVVGGQTFRDFTPAASVASSTATATLSFTFDDEFFIAPGDRDTVELQIRFNALDGVDLREGTTIAASVDASNVSALGLNEITEKSGGASGEVHTLRTEGLTFDVVSLNETRIAGTGNNPVDTAEFELVVDVTALGDQFFVQDDASEFAFQVTKGGTPQASASSTPTLSSNATKQGGAYRINEGQTRTFTLKITYFPEGDTGAYRAQFQSLNARPSPTGTPVAQPFTPASEFQTADVVIQQ